MNRRNFISTALAGVAATSLSASPLAFITDPSHKYKAIAFDAFPIFDPRPVFSLVEKLFPEKGTELSNIWRAKQFEYSWLRMAGSQYKDFWQITEDALIFAVRKNGISLSTDQRKQLMDQYLELNVWPDVIPALDALRKTGIRISFLSNMTEEMLTSSMKHAHIESYFEEAISTDRAKTFKPDPRAYQLGVDTLNLKKEEILFVAFAGWDASGAKWFGYPTFWVNRIGAPVEELNATPDATGKSFNDLVEFIKG